MDTKYYIVIILFLVENYSIIGTNKTWLRVIAMNNCPFWSSDSHAFKCNSECPFSSSDEKDENECPFKSLYKEDSYEGNADYTYDK